MSGAFPIAILFCAAVVKNSGDARSSQVVGNGKFLDCNVLLFTVNPNEDIAAATHFKLLLSSYFFISAPAIVSETFALIQFNKEVSFIDLR